MALAVAFHPTRALLASGAAHELGTPLAVTVDFDTLDDRAVTVRDRDSMEQERVSIYRLASYLRDSLTP